MMRLLPDHQNPNDAIRQSRGVCVRDSLHRPDDESTDRAYTSDQRFGQTQSHGAEQLPFHGSLQALETDVVAPPHLLVNGTATGTGTQLGRFTATFTATVTLSKGSATGSITFTAANGDRLDAAFLGQGTPTTEPNVASIEEIATINGGTGRFAGATGTFTIHRIVDQVTGVSTGSFDGVINRD